VRAIKLLVVAGAIWFAFHWWKGRGSEEAHPAQKSPNGFVSAVMPDGAKANTVLILAPVDCPSDAAQRADALSEELARLGIPNIRSSSYSSNITDPTEEQKAGVERAVSVLNGEIPAVFINGMAKANPTVEEVAFEYERTR
jgi:hypothetical protein